MLDAVAFLQKWQTLTGAMIGGFISLLVALIVATSATRREQRISAILLLSDLMAVRAAAENLARIAKEQGVTEERYPLWASEKLSWRRPRLSALFESNMARVISVDARLGAHLSLFKTVYTSIDDHVARVENDAQRLRTQGRSEFPRSPAETAADANVAAAALKLAGEHAAYAEYFLSAFVLNTMPGFMKRIRIWAWPNEIDRGSKRLLSEGRI